MKRTLLYLLGLLAMHQAYAQTFSPPIGIATTLGPGVFNLTPASICGSPYHEGAVWCTTTVDFTSGFILTFDASFDHAVGSGADGIAVVFGQNVTPTSMNGTNAFLGYYDTQGSPPDPDFSNSFGVEFDIFDNSFNPYLDDIPGVDHTAICLNAIPTTPILGPVAISPTVTNVKDGAFHNYKITWCPTTNTLEVYYRDTLRLHSVYNYASVFTTPTTIHWGITGGTGASCSNQIVQNIHLNPLPCSGISPCLVTSLVINTGYDPITGLAVAGGANGATPVPDPRWRLTSVSPGVATAIAATPIAGLVEVLPGNKVNVITTAGWPATYPSSSWISCLNSNTYYTDGTGITQYNMTLGRPFRLCSADTILIDCYVANDNYIPSVNVDGTPLAFTQPPTVLASNYSSFTHFSQNVYLGSGLHTLNIVIDDSNVSTVGSNPTGLNLHGTVSSATGTASLVSDIDTICSCAPPVFTCDSVSLPDSLHLCRGSVITMPAVLTGSYPTSSIQWTPATGLSDPTVLNPTLTANSPGWYRISVQSLIPYNLVVNGDFSAGNVGFSSGYSYVSGPSSLFPAGVYAISTNPHNEHPGAASFFDHTSGSGNMLAINGASTPINVWCQTIAVSPNTWYDFSAWFANWSSDTSTNLPIIQFEINGSLIGSLFTFPHPDGLWTQYQTQWYSGTATTASICINDQQTAGFGNDFAVDDISFQELCVSTDSIYIATIKGDTSYNHSDTSICATEGTVTLTAPNGHTWLWSTASTAQSISVNASGTYWVNIPGGCDSLQSDTFHVSINPMPVVTLRPDTTVCAGVQLRIGSPEPPGMAYAWNTGSTDSSIYITTAGTYILTVSKDGCSATGSTNLGVIDAPSPISLGPDTIVCRGEEVVLTSNYSQTRWSDGSYKKSITVYVSGTYWASVSNQCGVTADSVHVDVEDCDLWFPNAFTPNGDNLNDIARVVGNLKMFKGFALSIFNRWGQRVFFTNDIYSGWDGIFNGVRQDLGVYFYMIFYTLEGKQHMLKGDLQLIR